MPFNPMPGMAVRDIASGDNHILIVSKDGDLYTFGVGEQGQLGRVPIADLKFGLASKDIFLKPQRVTVNEDPDIKFDRVWGGNFTSFARSTLGRLYSWGLNNYSQLGFPTKTTRAVEPGAAEVQELIHPFPIDITESFPHGETIEDIACGQHHTLARTKSGKIFSFGRFHYGRLGHGKLEADVQKPKLIEALKDEKVIKIACGNESSFFVTENGTFLCALQ